MLQVTSINIAWSNSQESRRITRNLKKIAFLRNLMGIPDMIWDRQCSFLTCLIKKNDNYIFLKWVLYVMNQFHGALTPLTNHYKISVHSKYKILEYDIADTMYSVVLCKIC